MLVVEYLLTISNVGSRFNTVNSFKNLIQTDSRIILNENNLKFLNLDVNFNIQSGKIGDSNDLFYYLILSCNSDKKLEEFTELLRAVRKIIASDKDFTIQELRNDISLHYCQEAYTLIYQLENLMRKLITKFMVIKVGIEWKHRIPENVSISQLKGVDNTDRTHLHNYDFIQLSELLFSDRFPDNKNKLNNKLRSAKNITDLNLDEVKSLLPSSNWDKHFS